jgi:hypothetical protein
MIKLLGLWLVGCGLCVTPVAAGEDVYDGPTAIRPLTVAPQPQHSSPPGVVCDFEHQCYPNKGGAMATDPATPPTLAERPPAARPARNPNSDEPAVGAWRDCVDAAVQSYEQSHNLHALRVATSGCQTRLEMEDGADFAAEESTDPPPPRMGRRRNIGCGWWPVGSDADRDCLARGHRF